MAARKKTSVTISDTLLEELRLHFGDGHDNMNVSFSLSRLIGRYSYILYAHRAELHSKFSDNELSLILDSCNGVAFMEIVSMRLLWANIADGIDIDQLDDKWEVDGAALVDKLRSLSLMENIAMVDAIKCWWNRVGNGEQPEYAEMLDVPEHSDVLVL